LHRTYHHYEPPDGRSYLPADDRRHDVSWSERKKEDFDAGYWNKIWGWYDAGGDRHVAAYLATLDISDFDPKAPPPKTPAFWNIVNANCTGEEGELQDALDDLGTPDAVTIELIRARVQAGNTGDVNSLYHWLGERKNRKAAAHRLETCGYRAVNNPDAKDGLWRVGGQRRVVYAKNTLSLGEQKAAAEALQRGGVQKKQAKPVSTGLQAKGEPSNGQTPPTTPAAPGPTETMDKLQAIMGAAGQTKPDGPTGIVATRPDFAGVTGLTGPTGGTIH
jgi:hypothetical protein